MTTKLTEAALFDQLRLAYGVGDWDEDHAQPYWKWRAIEIGKLKRSRAARKVSLEDMFLALDYCQAHRIDIRNATWLYKHILPAVRWDKERRSELAVEDFEANYQAGLQEAYDAGDEEWIGRFTRALGEAREEVLAEWRARS